MSYGLDAMHALFDDAREARLQDEANAAAQPKFCKDCRWMGNGIPRIAKCMHELAKQVNLQAADYLVTGIPGPAEYYFCSTMRAFDPCGPDGKLWEPKS